MPARCAASRADAERKKRALPPAADRSRRSRQKLFARPLLRGAAFSCRKPPARSRVSPPGFSAGPGDGHIFAAGENPDAALPAGQAAYSARVLSPFPRPLSAARRALCPQAGEAARGALFAGSGVGGGDFSFGGGSCIMNRPRRGGAESTGRDRDGFCFACARADARQPL